MKHQNLALITAMFALSACGAPQYSTAKLNSEVNALSKVSSDILSQPKLAKSLSGDFNNDLSKIVTNSSEYIVAVNNYNSALAKFWLQMQIENFKFQQALMPDKLLKMVPVWPRLRNAAPARTSRSANSSLMAAPALPE